MAIWRGVACWCGLLAIATKANGNRENSTGKAPLLQQMVPIILADLKTD